MRRFSWTIIILLFALGTTLTQAATPTKINYQGRLTDGSGNPVPDSPPLYSIVFTIYDDDAGTNVIWTETQSVSTTDGFFAVILGTDNPITDDVFAGATRYLGIKVGGDPEISPKTMLVSVPYAQRVATVDGSTGGRIFGNLDLDNSTASTGIVYKSGLPFLHNYGLSNTFVGREAGNLTMSGDGNTATGSGALFSNTSGSDNTANGNLALWRNTSGNNNTATGEGALSLNTSGSQNTASGWEALFNNTTGTSNTASGHQALRSNTSGTGNTASGLSTLSSNSLGNFNTASGYSALASCTSGGNTACGYVALTATTTGNDNTSYGTESMIANTDGSRNTASGFRALSSNITGDSNTAVGSGADVSTGNLTNATAIGYNAKVDASNKVRIGNAAVTVIETQVGLTVISDSAAKENFQPVDGEAVLEKLDDLNIQTWNYKGHDPEQFRHYGPIAQEFYAAFGNDGVGTIGTSTSINSQDLDGVVLAAIQALQAQNRELRALLEKQQGEIESLKRTVKE